MRHLIFSFFLFFTINVVLAQKQCSPGDPNPPCSQMGCAAPDCKCGPGGPQVKIPVIGGYDPNLIIGPAGYDSLLKWVSSGALLPYRILFENDPDSATAPARKVIIYLPIHPNINPSSLRLGDFGFGSFVFSVPDNTTIYTNRLDVRDSLGLFVDITAGLDISNRRAFWIFESIDPATGLSSTLSPDEGFLPINDTTLHNGEGFVTLTLQCMPNVQTRDTIFKKASIIFDDNEAIETNIEKNTIDAKGPQSTMTLGTVIQDTIHLYWTGADDASGSGIKDYSLYVSENNGPFTLYKKEITATHEAYPAVAGNVYCFFTRARDNTGNYERLKDSCALRVGGGVVPLSWLYFNGRKQDDIIILNWATGYEQNTDKYFVERATDGINFAAIGSKKAAGNSNATNNYQHFDTEGTRLPVKTLYYRIRQTDLDGKFSYSNIVSIRITSVDNEPLVRVYPNPFNTSIIVEVRSNTPITANDRMEIYSNSGIMVYKRSLSGRMNSTRIILNDLPKLAAGIYYLRIFINGEKQVIKIMKE
jgi:hypothetical protein